MHHLLILLPDHVVLDRICDEVGLISDGSSFEVNILIGIWRNKVLSGWILIPKIDVISIVLLYKVGTWYAVFDYI